jgi:hypothetical protein
LLALQAAQPTLHLPVINAADIGTAPRAAASSRCAVFSLIVQIVAYRRQRRA